MKMSNIKGILIFLVVFGHLIEVYKTNFYEVYNVIYSFHMPLFILLSGYFAKHISKKKIINLALLYVIFQTLFEIFFSLATMNFKLSYTVPYFHLWYLLSMVFWYLTAYLFVKRNIKISQKLLILIVALCVSLFSRFVSFGFFDGYLLSYQRTLSFTFFFFLGFLIDNREMEKIKTFLIGKTKWIVISVSLVTILTYIQFANPYNLEMIFRGVFSIDTLHLNFSQSFLQIIICYTISTIMCFLILNIVGSQKTFLTSWGDNSLYIFLFHAFFLIPLQYVPILSGTLLSVLGEGLLLLSLFVYAFFVTMFLNSRFVIKYTSWLCHPISTVEKFKKHIVTISQ